MMKKFIIFIFSMNIYAQENDSLFWLDVNILDDDLPKFPLIINKVLSGKYMPNSISVLNMGRSSQEIFRIQIFESSVASIAKAEAKRFQNILGDTVYIDFETPLYKLRIGNYKNRKNAEKAIESISRLGSKDAWIIRTKAKSRKK